METDKYGVKIFSNEFINVLKRDWDVNVNKSRSTIRLETGLNNTTIEASYSLNGDVIDVRPTSIGTSLEMDKFDKNIEMYKMILEFKKAVEFIDFAEKIFTKKEVQ